MLVMRPYHSAETSDAADEMPVNAGLPCLMPWISERPVGAVRKRDRRTASDHARLSAIEHGRRIIRLRRAAFCPPASRGTE
jgi:hypothetical protein